ncbi:hypothetical protein D6774_00745 [Candidatus Woesearchaeota archaeon]|jgi:hypothetical protein|nr:MAG: hypothetical protein D6774_00745 [Candidatus Woesearchaeota archaeon]
MTIVNFTFTDIDVHRELKPKGKVSIKSNISIDGVEPYALSVGSTTQQGCQFLFKQETTYSNLGHIKLKGRILYLGDEAKVKEILEKWKKEKKLQKQIFELVANKVIEKSSIQSAILSDAVGLPPPIQLQRIKVK